MKKSVPILSAALLLAFSAAAYLGALLHQQQKTQTALEEQIRTQAAESEREVQRLDQNAKQLEAQLSRSKGSLAAAKARADERENELTGLRDKNAELEKLAAQSSSRLEFQIQQSKFAHYDTADQILALPACTLTDAQNHTCSAGFKDKDGRPFYIGGPGASREVAGFINSLEEGKTYSLPSAFIEYQKKEVLCETTAQLLALKSCTVTVTEIEENFALFKNKDGTTLQVGGDHISPEVKGFIDTLKERTSYSLPAAFVEYQKKHPPAAATPKPAPPEPDPPKPVKGDQF